MNKKHVPCSRTCATFNLDRFGTWDTLNRRYYATEREDVEKGKGSKSDARPHNSVDISLESIWEDEPVT